MLNILLLLVCLVAGAGLRYFRKVPPDGHMALNAFILHLALPALILVYVHNAQLDRHIVYAVGMPWLLFIVGAAVFWTIARLLSLPSATTGALMLTGGLGNTSFVGIPMIEAFYGKDGIATGLLIDQLGSYMVLSTLGITVACICSRGSERARGVVLRILTFPPLIALALALLLRPVAFPPWLLDLLGRIGSTLAPLALVSVGMQLKLEAWRINVPSLSAGLTYKLLAAPALAALFYIGLVGIDGPDTRVTLLEAAMGPQIGGAIVATQYGLNPPLVTLMVGAGTVLAFATVPMWWIILGYV